MNEEFNREDHKYALVAVENNGNIIHFVSYSKPPTYKQHFDIIRELRNDEQFKMTDMIYGEDYILMTADQKIIENVLEALEKHRDKFLVVEHEKDYEYLSYENN